MQTRPSRVRPEDILSRVPSFLEGGWGGVESTDCVG
jgi:hypothetical protein